MLTPLPVRTARSGWAFYFYIPMITETNKIPYPKHLISFTDQINLLKQRGMIFDDEPKALQLLQNISYYRLSGYWYPLLVDKNNIFSNRVAHLKQPITFTSLTVNSANWLLQKLKNRGSSPYADSIHPFTIWCVLVWRLLAFLKSCPPCKDIIVLKVEEYSRSDEEFIKAFKAKYSNHSPSSWITMEITSFGTLSILYENLLPGKNQAFHSLIFWTGR